MASGIFWYLRNKSKLDSIVPTLGDYYIKCESADAGALLVVESGAITGQINLADISPRLSDYTPVTGDYVTKAINLSNAEVVSAKTSAAKGKTFESLGARLEENETQLAQKANEVDVRKKAVLIGMGDLSQEVKTGMTGGSVAVVGAGSTGVTNLASDLSTKLGEYIPVNVTQVLGYYNNGSLSTLSTPMRCATLPVVAGEKYKISLIDADWTKTIEFINASGTLLSTLKLGDGTTIPVFDSKFTIPTNAVTMHINSNYGFQLWKFGSKEEYENVKRNAETKVNVYDDITDDLSFVSGKIYKIDSSGILSAQTLSTHVSCSFDVSGGDVYKFQLYQIDGAPSIYFDNHACSFLRGNSSDPLLRDIIVEVPENSHTLYFSAYTNNNIEVYPITVYKMNKYDMSDFDRTTRQATTKLLGSVYVDSEINPNSENPVQNKAVYNALNSATFKFKGKFFDLTSLQTAYPSPLKGDYAYIGKDIYSCATAGTWSDSGDDIAQVSNAPAIALIAASNAPDSVKAIANYVCTGSNDDIVINNLIQHMPAKGGQIDLSMGLFSLTNSPVIDRPIKLIGQGVGINPRPPYTTTNGRAFENMYGTVYEGITTMRCDADIIGLRVYNASIPKLNGIVMRDFMVQGYGKDRHTKAAIQFDVETDLLLIDNIGVYDAYVGLYSWKKAMDAGSIINSSFQWCGLGLAVKMTFGRDIGNNCIADNNGIKDYDGVTFNCGGAALTGNAKFTRNQLIRTVRYNTDDASGVAGCALYLYQFGRATLIDNRISTVKGNGIHAVDCGSVDISGGCVTDVGTANMANNRYGIYLDNLSTYFKVHDTDIGKASAQATSYCDYGVYAACTWGKHHVHDNNYLYVSDTTGHYFADGTGTIEHHNRKIT